MPPSSVVWFTKSETSSRTCRLVDADGKPVSGVLVIPIKDGQPIYGKQNYANARTAADGTTSFDLPIGIKIDRYEVRFPELNIGSREAKIVSESPLVLRLD